jgi:hypothetical protein
VDQPFILCRSLGELDSYAGERFGGTLTWADAANPPSIGSASHH